MDPIWIKLLSLGIPFLLALFIPEKAKKDIDKKIDQKIKDKFGGKS